MQRTKINEKYVVELTPDEKSELRRMTTIGRESSRKFRRAHTLLLSDAGKTDKEIREILGVSLPTIERTRKRYVEGGLDLGLNENPRIGRPLKVDGKVEAHMVALACSNPPTGRAKWTMQLLADRLVELTQIESISSETVRLRLKKVM